MPTTLLEFRTRLRRYLGEPYAASETSLNGTWRDAELNDDINDAARAVCSECITPDKRALLKKTHSVRADSTKREYLLPYEVAEVLFVEYWNGSVRYIIPQDPSLQAMINGVTNAVTRNIPYGYQVYRSGRYVITEGIATSGSGTTVVDTDRTGDAVYGFAAGTAILDDEGSALAANDVVENVTDGSEAAISAVTSATTLTFAAQSAVGGLSGGNRNNFELGDYYRVVQKEANRPVMFLNPPTSGNDETAVIEFTDAADDTYAVGNTAGTNQKVAQSFLVTRDTVMRSVELYLGASTGTPLGSMVVRIETDSASAPSGTLADFRAKAVLDEDSLTASAWNKFVFRTPFRLAANTTYWIMAEIPAQSGYYASPNNNYRVWSYDSGGGYANGNAATYNGSAWTAASANDMLFKVNAATSDESLYVHYAALPTTMSADATIMELPYIAEETVLRYAMWLGLRKKFTVGGQADNAYQMYQMALDELKRWVHRDGTQGYGGVRNVMPTGRGTGMQVRRTADPARLSMPRTFG